MDIIDLEKLAECEKINIYNCKMNTKSKIIKYDGTSILMDYSQICSIAEEKYCLSEELGHYYYDAYYTLNNINIDKTIINKQEYRAQKWQIKTLIPAQKLAKLFEKGYNYSYEIAEELCVPEELVKKAYSYYKENNMIECH